MKDTRYLIKVIKYHCGVHFTNFIAKTAQKKCKQTQCNIQKNWKYIDPIQKKKIYVS